MSDNDFYIGWLPKAPPKYASFVKRFVPALLLVVVITACVLSLSQKKFRTGNFEFGRLTELKGVYFDKPVPCLKVVDGLNIFGNREYITVLLIGYGKSGAEGIIADLQKERAVALNGKEVTLNGTLLYNDGKLIMQIDANDKPLIHLGSPADVSLDPIKKELGTRTLKGEIVDPKCFFGVMKPGEGKPHKDCAIRCILGGMPPVLKVRNEKGDENFYLVVGPQGEKMNQELKDFVAAPVELQAHVVQYDDWIVLYLNDKSSIKRISRLNLVKPGAMGLACAGYDQ